MKRTREGETIGQYLLAWFPMVVVAVANGALRDLVYGKYMEELRAHQLSTALGVLWFGIYMWGVIRVWRPTSAGQAGAVRPETRRGSGSG